MIEVAEYTSAAEMVAAYKAVRNRAFPPSAPVRFIPDEPKPKQARRSPLWANLSVEDKCNMIRSHWYEGISSRLLAHSISEQIGVPITKGAVLGMLSRHPGMLVGITLPERPALKYVYKGREMSLREISKETGVSTKTISRRLGLGWEMEDAATLPTYCNQTGRSNRQEGAA